MSPVPLHSVRVLGHTEDIRRGGPGIRLLPASTRVVPLTETSHHSALQPICRDTSRMSVEVARPLPRQPEMYNNVASLSGVRHQHGLPYGPQSVQACPIFKDIVL